MLDETCNELSKNGLKKIILLSGYGGNPRFLTFFMETQLAKQRDYVVVLFSRGEDTDPERTKELKTLKKTTHDGHAGES